MCSPELFCSIIRIVDVASENENTANRVRALVKMLKIEHHAELNYMVDAGKFAEKMLKIEE